MIGILGGGISGLALAHQLHEHQLPLVLIEKEMVLGGNARTIAWDDFLFDTGAHRFHHRDQQVTQLVQRLLAGHLNYLDVPSAIYWNKRFIDFPISPINLLLNGGLSSAIRGMTSFIRAKLSRHNVDNFEQLAIARYGKFWAKNFLLDYSEKLWGRPSALLSSQVAGKRLNGLSFGVLLRELLFGTSNKTAHLDGSFYYPHLGIGMLAQALEAPLPSDNLRRGQQLSKLNFQGNTITDISTVSEKMAVNEVYSSLPLQTLLELIPGVPDNVLRAAKSLRYRSLQLILIKLKRSQVSSWGSIYFPQKCFTFTRAYEPKNRSQAMAPDGLTSLVLEVPCFLDQYPDLDALQAKCLAELTATGIIRESEVIEAKTYTMKDAYPVLSIEDLENKEKVLRYLSHFPNLHLIGRSGKFEYLHLHDLLREAMQMAAGIAST